MAFLGELLSLLSPENECLFGPLFLVVRVQNKRIFCFVGFH